MADDDFGDLYGYGDLDAQQEDTKPRGTASEAQAKPAEAAADDDALFLQLYGEEALDSAAPSPAEVAAAPQWKQEADAGPVGAPENIYGDQQPMEEADSDDDLMITLDENATSYEPQANRYQYTRNQPDAGFTAPQDAVGAAPGQHFDDAGQMSGTVVPGGFGSRTAIGGVPRSAIPGLNPTPALQMGGISGGIPGLSSAAPAPQAPAAPNPEVAAAAAAMASGRTRMLRAEDAVWPSQHRPGLGIKLPGQTRVSPDEYKEFLNLGHGEIFSIDIDAVVDAPWRIPGIDPSDFFNFGMNERTWKEYIARVNQYRLEFTLKGEIQTIDQAPAQRPRGHMMMGGIGMGTGGMGLQHADSGPMGEGEDFKDRNLGTSFAEAQDEHYEAFVTSERPKRTQWQRYGSPWEHIIVLTGHDVKFGDEDQQQQQPQFQQRLHGGGGMSAGIKRPAPAGGPGGPPERRPFHGAQRPPPPPGPPPLGDMPPMALPPPFMGMGYAPPPPGMGGMPALPPPFLPGPPSGGQDMRGGGMDQRRRDEESVGGAHGLASGMDLDMSQGQGMRGAHPRGPPPPGNRYNDQQQQGGRWNRNGRDDDRGGYHDRGGYRGGRGGGPPGGYRGDRGSGPPYNNNRDQWGGGGGPLGDYSPPSRRGSGRSNSPDKDNKDNRRRRSRSRSGDRRDRRRSRSPRRQRDDGRRRDSGGRR